MYWWLRTSEKKVGVCASHLLAKLASHVVSGVFFDRRWQLQRRAYVSANVSINDLLPQSVEDGRRLSCFAGNNFVCQRILSC